MDTLLYISFFVQSKFMIPMIGPNRQMRELTGHGFGRLGVGFLALCWSLGGGQKRRMYGIFTCNIWLEFMVYVGKCSIHGPYGGGQKNRRSVSIPVRVVPFFRTCPFLISKWVWKNRFRRFVRCLSLRIFRHTPWNIPH